MRALLAAVLLAHGCACESRRKTASEERRQAMEGLTLSQSAKGVPSWTLQSKRALLREDERHATLTEPAMEFYRGGKAVSHVTALSGEINTDTQDVLLSSSVVFDSYEDKSRLTTDSLVYSSARGRLSTTADVMVRRPDGVLRGKGLEAKPDFSEIRIFDQRTVLSGAPK